MGPEVLNTGNKKSCLVNPQHRWKEKAVCLSQNAVTEAERGLQSSAGPPSWGELGGADQAAQCLALRLLVTSTEGGPAGSLESRLSTTRLTSIDQT